MLENISIGLSENFSFSLYSSTDASTLWKGYQFWLIQKKKKKKKNNQQSWKFSEVKFWTKLEIQNSANGKPFNLKF